MRIFTESKIRCFLKNLQEQHVECHSIVIMQNGRIILNKSFAPFRNGCLYPLYSVSKSFSSMAVGNLIEEKKIDLNDAWLSYFPEYCEDAADGFENVTVRHLLTMTMGQDSEPVLRGRDDWLANTVSKPLVHAPGTYFFYDSMCTHLLSALVTRVTGMTMAAYLDEILMKPLGITAYYWDSDQHGITAGGFGLHLSTADLAKFGQFILDRGKYQGKQIIPAHWIDEAVKKQVDNADQYPMERTENRQGYGYQFWMCSHAAYRASGLHGQICFIQPENELVIAMNNATTGSQAVLNCLYPAMYGDEESTEEISFSIPLLQGKKNSSFFAEQYGKEMHAMDNPGNIKSLRIDRSQDDLIFHFQKEDQEYSFAAGYGRWLPSGNHFRCFSPIIWHNAMNDSIPEAYGDYLVYGNYAWISEDVLKVQLRMLNHSGIWNIEFHADAAYFTMQYQTEAVYTSLPAYEAVFRMSETIRVMRPEDPLWKRTEDFIMRENWGTSLAERMKHGSWEDWECVIISMQGKEITGFLDAVKNDNMPDYPYTPYIGYVYVSPSARGRHISMRLIAKAEEVFKKNGMKDAWIVTGWTGLYEKTGYTFQEMVKDYKGRDARLYHKNLH